jgi:hypothetical protein
MPGNPPPIGSYPIALDTNYSLFLVYNTAETVLIADNQPWASEILIQAVDGSEIWADNGFANLSGELFYYDSVSKDINGKVNKFTSCVRNLGGSQTRYNVAGTWVRGFVIAEHHEQIADAILAVEGFVGISNSLDTTTLDYRIRHLAVTSPVFDDFGCPDITFTFTTVSTDPIVGTLINYSVSITGNGSFSLQFGDGTSTTTQATGSHLYAPHANIDPVVVLTNSQCQIVQTPIARSNIAQPNVAAQVPPFVVPAPLTPTIAPIVIPSINIPSSDIFIPPVVFPCLETTPFNISFPSFVMIEPPIPSVIGFGPINIPSLISFYPINIPNTIAFTNVPSIAIPSQISFIGQLIIPSVISFISPNIPSVISISPNIPSVIVFGNVPNFPSIISFAPAPSIPPINWGTVPTVSVSWGTPPSVTCTCSVVCPMGGAMMNPPPAFGALGEVDPSFNQNVVVDYDLVGFPSVINIVPPEIKPITVKHDIPEVISLKMPDLRDIRILSEIPHEIKIIPPDKEMVVNLVPVNIPSSIRLEVPQSMAMELKFPEKMPMIDIDASSIPREIQVVGVPSTIRLEVPETIRLEVPPDLYVPLRFEGPPISVQINLGLDKLIDDSEEGQCFRLVPCRK